MRTKQNLAAPGPTPASLTVALARHRHPAVGRNRIYAAIASGALLGIRVGRRLAIPVDALDSWVTRGCPLDNPDADPDRPEPEYGRSNR